jgi:subtilisin family serine protease
MATPRRMTLQMILGSAFALGVATAGAASTFADINRFPHAAVPGEIVIGFERDRKTSGSSRWSKQRTVNLLSLLGDNARIVREMPAGDGIVVAAPTLQSRAGIDAALKRLNGAADVYAAEPNYLYYGDDKPADPRVGEMWFLDRIAAFDAWRDRSSSPGIVVAVIDTGIQLDHEDLKDRIWTNPNEIPGNGVDDDRNGYIDDIHGWNFIAANNMPTAEFVAAPTRTCRARPGNRKYEHHGTHVAGTIGSTADNGVGGAGVTHDVRIMALKVLGGPCGAGSISGIFQAIAYAVANGAKVINLSLGGPNPSVLVRREIQAAIDAGISIVAAAGNNGSDNDAKPNFPAAYPVEGLIAVAATDSGDALAKFSNYGRNSVDIAAPGVRILNAVPDGTSASGPRSGYRTLSGTSMAAPIVTGSVALMRAHNPKLDPAEIERRIVRAVDLVPGLNSAVRAGGRLNLVKVLREASRPVTAVAPNRKTPAAETVRESAIGGIRLEGDTSRKREKSTSHIPKSGDIGGKSLY